MTEPSHTVRRTDACEECGTFCQKVGGVPACGGTVEMYQTRYRCAGHPLGLVGNNCGWEGVLAGTDERDPSCPKCGGWVEKAGGAQLRRVK